MQHLQRPLGTGSILFVTHDTTQQTYVGVAYRIVHVYIHLKLRRNVNLVLPVLRYGVAQLVVKRMYALSEELYKAWLLKEEFLLIRNCKNSKEGEAFLTKWFVACNYVCKSRFLFLFVCNTLNKLSF